MAGRRLLFFVTLVALLLVLVDIVSDGALAAGVRDIVRPVRSIGVAVAKSVHGSGFFSSRASLEAQVAQLQSQLQQDQLQIAAFQVLEQENASLSQLEHLAQTTPGLTTPITSSVVSSPYGTFTIGAGSRQGVTQNSLVLEGDDFVVGKIAQVQASQSLVDEIFAPGAQTPIVVDGAAVVASGQGGDALAEVPHGIAVNIGDPVLASQLDERSIGTVAHVDSNPANAQQAVYISLPVALSSLQYVYVTTP